MPLWFKFGNSSRVSGSSDTVARPCMAEAAIWLGVYPDGALRESGGGPGPGPSRRVRHKLPAAGFRRSRWVALGGEGHDAQLLSALGGGQQWHRRGSDKVTELIAITALLRISSRHGHHIRDMLPDFGVPRQISCWTTMMTRRTHIL